MRSIHPLSILLLASLTSTSLADSPNPLSIAPNYAQLTFIFEDDGSFTKPIHKTDRHYTAGESISLALQSPIARTLGQSLADPFYHDESNTTYAIGLTATQQIFTPEDISTSAPIPSDRPYAATITGGIYLQRAFTPPNHFASFDHLELDLGVIGPSALGRQTQQFVHSRFHYDEPQGWPNQVNDEFGFNLKYIHKWRFDLWQPAEAFKLQLIPQAGLTLGTFDRNASASATARFGYNLPDDFGPARIADLPSATAATFHDFGAYTFFRAGGRLVEHSATPQGNSFRDYPYGVDIYPAVGELNAGISLQFLKHIDFGWNWTVESKEFHGQSGYDSYGTMSLSFFTGF